ncbi:hypothetical protein [Stackebrandtia soli]|uniref:hypothetical protein n=1 Tax=Stackebrandtia soli TaxID=1892856 RepID=UPI0039E8ECC8
MILLQRRSSRKRGRRIRGELVEGFGHLRAAGTHAAAGAKEKIAPGINNALTAVGLRKRRRSRWPWIAAAVAVATAAGVTSAVLWRRNSAAADTTAVPGTERTSAESEEYTVTSIRDREPELAGVAGR